MAAGSGRREGGREAGRRRLLDAEEGSLGGREVGEEGRECTGEGVEVLQAGLGVGSREAGCGEGHSVPEADDPGRLESLEMASGVHGGEFPELVAELAVGGAETRGGGEALFGAQPDPPATGPGGAVEEEAEGVLVAEEGGQREVRLVDGGDAVKTPIPGQQVDDEGGHPVESPPALRCRRWTERERVEE